MKTELLKCNIYKWFFLRLSWLKRWRDPPQHAIEYMISISFYFLHTSSLTMLYLCEENIWWWWWWWWSRSIVKQRIYIKKKIVNKILIVRSFFVFIYIAAANNDLYNICRSKCDALVFWDKNKWNTIKKTLFLFVFFSLSQSFWNIASHMNNVPYGK